MPHGKFLTLSILAIGALPLAAQQPDASRPIIPGVQELNSSSNLPIQKGGPEDLLGFQVYDAPEFTKTVRIAADGTIRLPMMKEHLRVEGLLPGDIEILLADALKGGGRF